ncbi:hypothetical protein ABPG77_008357 [Micractinium sp. CCAP 211/92]
MAAAAVQRPRAPPPPQQRYQGVQKDSAGYRLLSAMGWREGEGLGASKQGIKSHIKVKKKFENWGVGAVEAAEHAQNWTNGMLDFHRVLSNLSEVVSEHAKRRSGSSSSGSSSSESDASDASGDGSSDASSSSSSEDEAEQPQQLKGKKRKAAVAAGAAAEPDCGAPKRVRAATHTGRYKKREAAKMVKGYSEHDLAAILGGDPFAAAAAAVPEVRAQQRGASSSGYDSDTEPSASEEEDDSGKAAAGTVPGKPGTTQQQPDAQQQQQPERPPMIVLRRPMPAACRPPQPAAPQESRKPGWWQVCFHAAAGPASVGAAAAGDGANITIHGFSEQDQTNLYNLAHDKATQGRVGLGRSSMPKKVAGARWQGKKTLIHDSDGEGGSSEGEQSADEAAPLFTRQEGPEVGPAPAGVELEREEGLVIILPASKRHLLDALPGFGSDQQNAAPAAAQQQRQTQAAAAAGKPSKKAKKGGKAAAAAAETQQAQQPQMAAAAGDAVGKIKWKKAVSAALKASAKGKLKLSKLGKAIAKEQGVPKAQHAAALDALAAFLKQSSKFVLSDGVVRAA